MAAAYCSALAVAASTAASRARPSAASGSRDAEPDVRDADAVAARLDGRADGLAALGQLADDDPCPLGDAVAGQDRRPVRG